MVTSIVVEFSLIYLKIDFINFFVILKNYKLWTLFYFTLKFMKLENYEQLCSLKFVGKFAFG